MSKRLYKLMWREVGVEADIALDSCLDFKRSLNLRYTLDKRRKHKNRTVERLLEWC